MKNIFIELAKDLREIDPAKIHCKLSDQELREFPDLYYPFDEMIKYANKNWVDRNARDILIRDLVALKKIMQEKFDVESTDLKIQDDVILSLPAEALDGYMKKRKLSEVKSLFNPISKEAKVKINESYQRTHPRN